MAGDLEDFLRRAAERRKQKAQQGGGAPAPRQQSPQQYTDQRTERQPRQVPEDVVMAEVVESDHTYEARKQQVEQAKQLAQRARAEAAQKQQKVESAKQAARDAKRAAKTKSKAAKAAAAVPVAGNPTEQLLAMLRRPGGVQQAILLREILDRPEHRW